MYTLKDNYKKNVNILKENLKRGMTLAQVQKVIENFKLQFIKANLYGDDEKQFIKALKETTAKHFTGIDIVFID
jgi:predicted adenine nucleotide alpha hydrolase (AANH) superfamily ATPase